MNVDRSSLPLADFGLHVKGGGGKCFRSYMVILENAQEVGVASALPSNLKHHVARVRERPGLCPQELAASDPSPGILASSRGQ